MKIVAISDLHGDFTPVYKILEKEKPELLLCAGDWGTIEEIKEKDFEPLIEQVHTISVYGNNDALDLLPKIKNKDGSAILLGNGKPANFKNLTIGGINGIWAKSHKKPWYITDEEVIQFARQLSANQVDIFITHGCPIGMADWTPQGTHGGQRCFTEAFRLVQPRLHLCGHLHRPSQYQTKDGKLVVNVGYTREGDYAIFQIENGSIKFESKKLS